MGRLSQLRMTGLTYAQRVERARQRGSFMRRVHARLSKALQLPPGLRPSATEIPAAMIPPIFLLPLFSRRPML